MKKIFTLTLAFFIVSNTQAQKLPNIQLDRPDQTECPFITPKGYIQMENGFNFETYKSGIKNLVYPTSLTKYGVNENFELRLISTILTQDNSHHKTTGLLPITIGFKSKLMDEKGIIPQTSFIGHLNTRNWGSKEFRNINTSTNFRFVMQHTLSKKATLAYNLGMQFDGNSPNGTFIYTITNGISLSDKLGLYYELYGFLPEDEKADHRFDGGFTYLVNDDFILDISSGVGLSDSDLRNYLSLGISYRFKVKK